MDNNSFWYPENINKDITQIIENNLSTSVLSVEKIDAGEVSFTYKIKTKDHGNLIAKIFRFENFVPDKEKLEWIENQLSAHNIPFAKTLKISSNKEPFPFGYMIQEFIEGKNGFDTIMDNEMSFEDVFRKLLPFLKQVHQISIEGFGTIKDGKGEYKTFYESKLSWCKKLHQELLPLKDLDHKLHSSVFEKAKELKEYEHLMKSVLLHGDPTPHNAIITPNGQLKMIDWDNAGSGTWQAEYAGLTYKGAYMWQYSTEEERNKMIKEVYKEVYPEVAFEDPDLLEVIKILQILIAYSSLSTHYFRHKDLELYESAKKRLISMLGL